MTGLYEFVLLLKAYQFTTESWLTLYFYIPSIHLSYFFNHYTIVVHISLINLVAVCEMAANV